jgi:hypothetical protein
MATDVCGNRAAVPLQVEKLVECDVLKGPRAEAAASVIFQKDSRPQWLAYP